MQRFVTPLILLLLAACATAPAATPTAEQAAVIQATDVATAIPATDVLPEPTMLAATLSTAVPAEPTTLPAAARPAWQEIMLTNARSGESFTLADFAGKTVYVEPMATWCPNCRAQQRQVVSVFQELGDSGNYMFVSLSVGENISDADLAAYAAREGFGWEFAIAPPEMLDALVNAFGRAVLSPPSTPHFIVYPDGSNSDLITGPESSSALRTALTEA